jgi:hypothetical protein
MSVSTYKAIQIKKYVGDKPLTTNVVCGLVFGKLFRGQDPPSYTYVQHRQLPGVSTCLLCMWVLSSASMLTKSAI